MKTTYSAIVATDSKGLIGKNNTLPWHLPADLKHFKELTTGHSIVMGRKTFDSLPKGALPNRRNIVLSKNKTLQCTNAEVYHSPEQIFKATAAENEVFIIGGANIYNLFIPFLDKIYLTFIHHQFDGDTFFPALNPHQWSLISEEIKLADEKNKWDYSFRVYEKMNQEF